MPAGWWVEKDPRKRAELERMAGPAVDENACQTCAGARFVRVAPATPASVGTRLSEGMPPVVSQVKACPDCNAPQPDDLVRAARIPAAYASASFETFREETGKIGALAEVRAWVADGSRESLLLHGEPGRGKTHLGVAAVRALCLAGVGARFVQAVDYLDELKAGFADDSTEARERYYREVPVLMLDDIGAARPTEFTRDRVPALIEHRLGSMRATIITSDKTSDELLAMGYQTRLISRLKAFRLVRVSGEDMRGKR
ncbi:MAG: ATP-binding protein [Dehalococcoidia bacterium]